MCSTASLKFDTRPALLPRVSVPSSSRVHSTGMKIGPMKKRYAGERILASCAGLMPGCRSRSCVGKHGFSEPSYYAWKAKLGGMKVSGAQRLMVLESENTKLRKLLANSMLVIDAMREVLHGK